MQLGDAPRDLLAAQRQHALGPERLDVERGQHRAVGHRAPQQRLVDRLARVRGDVAHEAAGERVARAGGVDDVGRRVGREREVAVAREQRGAVLALLGDDDGRAEVEHRAGGAHEVRLVGELLELAVVEDHAVDAVDGADQRLVRDVDPQVHRVQRNEARVGALLAHLALEVGLDVGEEEDVGGRGGVRQRRLEVLEDVEVGLQRVADVDVALVAPGPEERLAAGHVLDVVGDDATGVQRRVLRLAEVVADRPDHAGVVEERGGEGEVDRGAPQQPVAAAGLGLDGVKGDGSDDGERHEARHGSVPAMRAVTISAFGGPEVLELVEDAPVPEAGEGQVLIRVQPRRRQLRRHARPRELLPLLLRAAAGPRRRGRRRRGRAARGRARRHRRLRGIRRAPAGAVFPLPDGISDTAALAMIIQGLSAWHLLRTSAKLAPGRASWCTLRRAASARSPSSSPSASARAA